MIRTIGWLTLVGIAFVGGMAVERRSGPNFPKSDEAHTVREPVDFIFARHQRAVVQVKGKNPVTYVTEEGKEIAETYLPQSLGLIIDPKGVVVSSYSSVDFGEGKAGMRMKPASADAFIEVVDVKSDLKDLEVHLTDGTVWNAAILGVDRKEDLVFIEILTPSEDKDKAEFPYVQLEKERSNRRMHSMDPLIGLSLDHSMDGAISVSTTPGYAIVPEEADRSYFLTTAGRELGTPLFHLNGDCAGLTVRKQDEGTSQQACQAVPSYVMAFSAEKVRINRMILETRSGSEP